MKSYARLLNELGLLSPYETLVFSVKDIFVLITNLLDDASLISLHLTSKSHKFLIGKMRPGLGQSWYRNICSLAANEGYLSIIEWFMASYNCPTTSVIPNALERGHAHILDKSDTLNFYYSRHVGYIYEDCAAKGGFTTSLKWLLDHSVRLHAHRMVGPIKNGYKEYIKMAITACLLGGEQVSNLSHDSLTRLIPYTMAEYGQLGMLRWFVKKFHGIACIDWDYIANKSIQCGFPFVAEWVSEKFGYVYTSQSMLRAVEGNQMDFIIKLISVGCPYDRWSCAHAAKHGFFHILQYLRENGCPWDGWTCAYAARANNLEILEWSIKNGCPFDEESYQFALRENLHPDIRKWIQENR